MGKRHKNVIKHISNNVRDILIMNDGKEFKLDSILLITNYNKPSTFYMDTNSIELYLKNIPIIEKKKVFCGSTYYNVEIARKLLQENPCILLESGKKNKRYVMIMGLSLFDIENIDFNSYRFMEKNEEVYLVRFFIKEDYGSGSFGELVYQNKFDSYIYKNNVQERIRELEKLFELRMIYDAYVSIGVLDADDMGWISDMESGIFIIKNCLQNYQILKNVTFEDIKRDFLLYYSSEYVKEKYRSLDYSIRHDLGLFIVLIEDRMKSSGLVFSTSN